MIEDMIDAMIHGLTPFGAKKFAKDMREYKINNARVVYHNNNTILYWDGEKYTAIPEKGEKFDAEKGLMVCLLKAMGITTSDFLKLYKNAEHYETKTDKKTSNKTNNSKKR